MSLEIAITKLAEAVEAQTKVLASLMASGAQVKTPANEAPQADELDTEAADAAAKEAAAKEAADKKAKAAAADKKAKAAAAKAKEEAEKATADDDDDDDDLLGGDDEVYTLDQVRDAMQAALADAKAEGEATYKKMREALSAVLKANGAAKVSELSEDTFAVVMRAISKAKDDLA